MTDVLVPVPRWERWVANFAARHGETVLRVADGALDGAAADGSRFTARLPFDASYAGEPQAAAFATAAEEVVPGDWGVLLVRKGGFAIARLTGPTMVQHKIGQRHVQGRSKAGGQSQQRFARRRENQAQQAYDAAGEHALRLLGTSAVAKRDLPVVVGGDRTAVETVLGDPRLAHLSPKGPWLPVPEPRRQVLDRAIDEGLAIRIAVDNR